MSAITASAVEPPILVAEAFLWGLLEGIRPYRKELGQAQRDERILPHVEANGPLLHED